MHQRQQIVLQIRHFPIINTFEVELIMGFVIAQYAVKGEMGLFEGHDGLLRSNHQVVIDLIEARGLEFLSFDFTEFLLFFVHVSGQVNLAQNRGQFSKSSKGIVILFMEVLDLRIQFQCNRIKNFLNIFLTINF